MTLDQFKAILDRLSAAGPSGCWLWPLSKVNSGYGGVWIGKKSYRAHRLSYELELGLIPPGMHCLHRCDTPACLNPRHLWLGTHAQNMGDMRAKGRRKGWYQGLAHKQALLTLDLGKLIRHLYFAERRSQEEISRHIGISQSVISNVTLGRSYV